MADDEPPRHRPQTFEELSRRSQQRTARNYRLASSTQRYHNEYEFVGNFNRSECSEGSDPLVPNENPSHRETRYMSNDIDMISSFEVNDSTRDKIGETDDENEGEMSQNEEEDVHVSDNEEEDDEYEDALEDLNQQEVIEQEEDVPLYEGARITVTESLLAILTFSLRYSLTGACLASILELIEMHCPQRNRCKTSLYSFRKYFGNIFTPLQRHFYCSNCYSRLQSEKERCEQCRVDTEVCYFIQIPLIGQLQTMYNRFDFIHQLQSRFNRIKKGESNYEDIYDGNIYKELTRPGNFLFNPDNISMTWNTDGISLFGSSNFQIWPFFLSINELPIVERTKKENLLLAGLWFGSKKPFPTLFLQPIANELETLQTGVNFEVRSLGISVRVQAMVVCGTCDLPAKALMLNMKQFNGEYGCQKCKIRSERFEDTSIRIYPFQRELDERTQAETNQFAAQAVHYGEPVFGVKGPSALSPFFPNYIRNTAVDEMHAVFLGNVKALLILWFLPGFSNSNWSLAKYITIVDKYLLSLRPPQFISRLPRSISEHMNYFKASELKAWFYYYSLPILKTIMPEIYFNHYLLLVNAINLLNKPSISQEIIGTAKLYLVEFVARFSDLYGPRHMTANLHSLLHLPQTVEDFGPLWVTSCFSFENANGQLKTLVTGTRFSGLQICNGISYFMAIPELLENLRPDSIVRNFCKRLLAPKKKFKSYFLDNDLSAVGPIMENFMPEFVLEILRSSDLNESNVGIFFRLMKTKTLYTSQMYRRPTKTNSTYVKFEHNGRVGFGITMCFIRISNCECKSYCAPECDAKYMVIIKKLIAIPQFNTDRHIYKYTVTDEIIVIDIKNLLCVCFHIEHPRGNTYILEPVNMIEAE